MRTRSRTRFSRCMPAISAALALLALARPAAAVPQVAETLAGPVAPVQYAQAAPGVAGEPVARVETIDGEAFAVRADGTRVALSMSHRGYVPESGRLVLDGTSESLLKSDAVKRIFLGA